MKEWVPLSYAFFFPMSLCFPFVHFIFFLNPCPHEIQGLVTTWGTHVGTHVVCSLLTKERCANHRATFYGKRKQRKLTGCPSTVLAFSLGLCLQINSLSVSLSEWSQRQRADVFGLMYGPKPLSERQNSFTALSSHGLLGGGEMSYHQSTSENVLVQHPKSLSTSFAHTCILFTERSKVDQLEDKSSTSWQDRDLLRTGIVRCPFLRVPCGNLT